MLFCVAKAVSVKKSTHNIGQPFKKTLPRPKAPVPSWENRSMHRCSQRSSTVERSLSAAHHASTKLKKNRRRMWQNCILNTQNPSVVDLPMNSSSPCWVIWVQPPVAPDKLFRIGISQSQNFESITRQAKNFEWRLL